jgi:hypothetical protein
MKLKDTKGRLKNRSITQYSIDWTGKSASKIQKAVKDFLNPYWSAKMVYEEFPVFGTRLRVDFLNLTDGVAIEVDGEQHNTFNKHFHRNSAAVFHSSMKRDVVKSHWIRDNGFTLVRIIEKEIPKLDREWFEERGVYL